MSISITPAAVTPLAAAAGQALEPALNPAQVVLRAAQGYVVSACLNVALKLRIPDLIGDGIQEIGNLAQQSGVNKDYLFRVLRVLEAEQIVVRAGAHSVRLGAAGQVLRRDVPGSMAEAVEWISDPLHLTLYSELGRSVKTGEITFDAVYGKPFFNWSTEPQNAEEAAVFNNAMTSISQMCVPAFLEAYPFGSYSRIVDVGGGLGAVLRAILTQHPHVRGTLAEMPSLLPGAEAAIRRDGLSGRCQTVPCNFFESVPDGGDLYFMKNIIHDWADEPALRILRNIRAVIPPSGTLVLAEAVLDDSPASEFAKLLDIEMIAFVGGRERSAEEFRQLLAQAGFALDKIVPTKSPLSLLEAVPV